MIDVALILKLIQIARLVAQGISLYKALHQAAPDLVPSFRDVAKELFPTLSFLDALGQIEKGIFTPHKMTPEEEQRWFDRASGAV